MCLLMNVCNTVCENKKNINRSLSNSNVHFRVKYRNRANTGRRHYSKIMFLAYKLPNKRHKK